MQVSLHRYGRLKHALVPTLMHQPGALAGLLRRNGALRAAICDVR